MRVVLSHYQMINQISEFNCERTGNHWREWETMWQGGKDYCDSTSDIYNALWVLLSPVNSGTSRVLISPGSIHWMLPSRHPHDIFCQKQSWVWFHHLSHHRVPVRAPYSLPQFHIASHVFMIAHPRFMVRPDLLCRVDAPYLSHLYSTAFFTRKPIQQYTIAAMYI